MIGIIVIAIIARIAQCCQRRNDQIALNNNVNMNAQLLYQGLEN